MKRLLFLSLSPFLLSACLQSSIFGVPQEQWERLTEEQRSAVISGYNQRQQWDQLNQEQRAQVIAAYNQRQAAALETTQTNRKMRHTLKATRPRCKEQPNKTVSENITSSKQLLASSIIGSLKWMISE